MTTTQDGEPVPGTYHSVDHEPQKILLDSIKAPINGMYGIQDETGNISFWNTGELFGAIDVALFIIIIGGFLGVTMKTGAINAGIARVVSSLKGREKWMIPALMVIFALGGTSYGMAEETLAFYPLIITVMIAAGYDALSAVAVILLGAGIGVLGSTVNPFATGIASGFANVSIGDGLPLRLVILVVGLALGIFFVMRYAERVKKDPSKSLIFAQKEDNEARFLTGQEGGDEFGAFTGRHKIVLVLFLLAFVAMVYGVIPWSDLGIPFPTLFWWFPEMTASFLLFAVLVGVAGGLSEKDLTGSFVDGSRDLLGVALIIGIARGITVIMNNGMITDTVLNWAESAVSDLSGARFVLLLFILFIPLSFLIPSSSGLATVAMPIMAPARLVRWCRRGAGRQCVPVRQRHRGAGHAHLGGGHGRSGDRPDRIRDLVEVCLANPGGLDGPLCGRIGDLPRRSSARAQTRLIELFGERRAGTWPLRFPA